MVSDNYLLNAKSNYSFLYYMLKKCFIPAKTFA